MSVAYFMISYTGHAMAVWAASLDANRLFWAEIVENKTPTER